ncbi:MAG: magnesium/cobalt transporter CorA [Verrucomicrobiae bacterium]|nr:magnesium/cobalt transporter CorA [Verrucomicrobiae bacterium]
MTATARPATESEKLPAERQPGQSPDELVHIGERRVDALEIEWIVYDSDRIDRRLVPNPSDIPSLLRDTPDGMTQWLRVTGLHEVEAINQLADALGIHPLARQDVLNTHHRPKVEQYEDCLFVTVKLIGDPRTYVEDEIGTEQLSVFLMPRLLVTFHESHSTHFHPVLERLQQGNQRIRQLGAEYLAWAVLDVAVDHYFPVIDWLEDRMDHLEEQLFEGTEKVEAHDIFVCRRQATTLSHIVRPLRDVSVRILRMDSPLLTKTTEPFFRDLADHGGHLAAAVESLREASISLRDFHSIALSNQLNEVMRFLASFSALFLPLTFLAGIYGMNFESMPELKKPWAYPALWCVFAIISACMFFFFRKKRWI